MIQEGQVVLLRFPTTDMAEGKLRPAVVVRKLPGPYEDWLVCMISSQINRAIDGFDEVISTSDSDYGNSGLKVESVIRVSRIAAVAREALVGAVGYIASERLERVRLSLSDWINGE
ncbi:MAG: type II toxin-antitoxin system PemK/MazF family toxin [Spirochaetales bacterium]|nr:type II toxin-antitoxin system PemK/MazF family toxin [Spirochaetales bacterium]